ncbi:MAG: glycosyltransferase family 2 protein [Actinobacteria bacterium]|nr:glycosyltransferase family 2 protein [Actinomycetota bacterium]
MTVPQIPGVRVRSRHEGRLWQVSVRGVHGLQRLAVVSVGLASLVELEVSVAAWKPPMAGWLGTPGLMGLSALDIETDNGGIRLRLRAVGSIDAALMLSAAVRCLRPTLAGEYSAMLTFVPGLTTEAAPLGGAIRDVLADDEERDRHVRRSDVLVVGAAADGAGVETATTVVVGREQWLRDGMPFDVCIDPTVHRPVGRRSSGGHAVANADVSGTTLTVRSDGAAIALTDDVTAAQVRALRGTAGIVTTDDVPLRLRHQLTACGIVVADSASALPDGTDHLGWQAMSVAARRHVLRQYGPSAAIGPWPSVSVVMATNRPDHLENAMHQLSGLRYPSLEIVIGAHGSRVDPARVWDLAQDVPHPVTVIAVDEARTLGEVLQACSDRAEGVLITKMDDDDVYGAEHVWDLVLARQYSGADIVGKTLDWIYLESENATVFRPVFAAEKYADFVAGGTMLISRADLMAVGGWRPVPKSVDRALLDRVLTEGGLVYRTHGLGYVYVRHSAGHTASVADDHFLTRNEGRYGGLIVHEAFGTAVQA